MTAARSRPRGSDRRSDRRSDPRPGWRVAGLALAVAATSVAVPPLILSWARQDPGGSASSQVIAPVPSSTTSSTSAAPSPESPRPSVPAADARTASPPGASAGTTTTPGTGGATRSTSGRGGSGPSSRTPATPSPAFRPLKIAAADPANTRVGVAVTECPLCASGSRVQYLGQGHALIVPVRDVAVGGRRTLTIVYQTVGSRTLFVDVNGDSVVSLTLEGAGSWEVPARVSIPIDLPAGDSQIKFYNATDPAPDLDQIRIN